MKLRLMTLAGIGMHPRPGRRRRAALHRPEKGQRRTVRLHRVGDRAELIGFGLAGDISVQACIKTVLQDELPAQAYGRLLLVPQGEAAGRGTVARHDGLHLHECD